jgi:Yip1 domain
MTNGEPGMDLNLIVARAKAILLSPRTEWPLIAERPETIQSIYKSYLIVIAAIPALFGFVMMGGSSFGLGLVLVAVRYAATLGGLYLMALVTDALAPNFGGQKNRSGAFKLVAYSATAGLLAEAGVIIPGIGLLIVVAGWGYTLYLFYLGLPSLMKVPEEKAPGYMGLVFLATAVFVLIAAFVLGSRMGFAA